MKIVYSRLSSTPFEVAVAALLIISGISGLLHLIPDQPSVILLPDWESYTLNSLSVVSGLFLIHGTGKPSRRIELSGLLLLLAVILSRFIIYLTFIRDIKFIIAMLVFDLAVILGTIARLETVLSGDVIVRVGQL
jgi:hypothetical protein